MQQVRTATISQRDDFHVALLCVTTCQNDLRYRKVGLRFFSEVLADWVDESLRGKKISRIYPVVCKHVYVSRETYNSDVGDSVSRETDGGLTPFLTSSDKRFCMSLAERPGMRLA